jgi:hypothetical protein
LIHIVEKTSPHLKTQPFVRTNGGDHSDLVYSNTEITETIEFSFCHE